MWLFSKELHSPVCTVHKSPATQYITPRELVVTHLIALSPSKFLFYVLHCFHLRTELPWKYPQQTRIQILFRNSDWKDEQICQRELVVTHLIALSPSKFLFYVLHCFHLRTELPWKYPQQTRIQILFRNSDWKDEQICQRELVVTHLIVLSPSKFLFYVLHCFHLQTELPWK